MAEFSKVPRITATMQVVNSVRVSIANGDLKVGDRLPPEAEMAKSLGVGRSSLREGMRILAAYGVVEIRQGEGTYIINRMAEQFLEFMGFLPNSENMLYMLMLRRIIEVGNVMELYDKLTEEQIQKLDAINQQLTADRSQEECARLDVEFHRLLISYSQNPLLDQINEMLTRMRIEMLRLIYESPEQILNAQVAHQKIIDALAAQDVGMSVEAVREHLDDTEKTMRIIDKNLK